VPPGALAPLAGKELAQVPIPAFVDAKGSLASFDEAVASLLRGTRKTHVRIAVFGDSNMTRDFISGGMRRALQAPLGDGGHGFVALGRPWGWYSHMDVRHDHGPKWRLFATSTHRTKDGLYGFANISTESAHPGATTWVQTAGDEAPVGKSVAAIDLFYAKRPYGGRFAAKIDGQPKAVLSARAERTLAAHERFEVAPGAHRFEVVVEGNGPVRLFGATFETATPGVVIDSLGVGALNYEQMTHVDSETRQQLLKERPYDLVMFLLGTNMFAPDKHEIWMKTALADFAAALPRTPIVVLSPPDSGMTTKDWTSNPRLGRLSEQLRDIAARNGWAFWDFYAAMGGKGSIRHFVKEGLAERDCIHFSRDGGALMGRRIAQALVAHVGQALEREPLLGCAVSP
jgi:lysophospholipase L1-like esterase